LKLFTEYIIINIKHIDIKITKNELLDKFWFTLRYQSSYCSRSSIKYIYIFRISY